MNRQRKLLFFILLAALVITILPTKQVGAAELKELQLNHSYYVSEAIMYKDKAFLVGGERKSNMSDVQVQVVVTNGANRQVVVPASVFNTNPTNPDMPFIIGETKSHLILGSHEDSYNIETVVLLNKDTYQYQKLSIDEFYVPYYQMLENGGYSSGEFSFEFTTHQDSSVMWVVAHKSPRYDDELSKEVPGISIVLHNSAGIVKAYEDVEVSSGGSTYFDSRVDSRISSDREGNFYYVNENGQANSFNKIDSKGNETAFTYSNQYAMGFNEPAIINGNIVYADYSSNRMQYTGVFQMKDGKLTELKQHYELFNQVVDGNGNLWYGHWDSATSGWAFGYLLPTSYTSNFVYKRTGTWYFDIYQNQLLVYSVDGYGFTTIESPGSSKNGWAYENGNWYYYKGGYKATGWVLADGAWYFLDGNGVMKKGWLQTAGAWYYLDNSGAMKTGWAFVGGSWYYFDRDGVMQKGWVQSAGAWYFMADSGAMKTGWLQSNGAWYYLTDKGVMTSGWAQVNGTWYYFDGSGAMKTGWLQSAGTWYFLDGSGAMKSGWLKNAGAWYFLDSNGAMKTGWVSTGGKWYYLYSSGVMATNTTIGGYKLGSDGAWIN
ncbi:hypothetical protein [Fredinandcohnia sp. 179-A 10B2 NHS]|uniref:hypothetical protein n=1 Tax=Fredinandcohnia sp. 179-A 10B2 NHS TaxID=3235176 RepID=UPI0039A38F3A